MKVYELLGKYRMCSDALVRLTVVPVGTTANVRYDELRDPPRDGVFALPVQGYDIIDNVMTIYAKGDNEEWERLRSVGL